MGGGDPGVRLRSTWVESGRVTRFFGVWGGLGFERTGG